MTETKQEKNESTVETKAAENKSKEVMKDLLTLDRAILVPKYAAILKKYVKLIYIILIAFLALFSLVGLVRLLTGQISLAIVQFIFVFAGFIIARMFCEFLSAYKK